MRAIDSDALKEYIKKTDLTAVERGALLQAISNMPTLTPPNEPLTLEQLRGMDDQPVWVKVIGITDIRCDGWCEVEFKDKNTPNEIVCVWWPGSEVEDIAKSEDYGKTWVCYAYPPAHIDRETSKDCPVCGKYKVILFRGYRTKEQLMDLSGKIHPHISGSASFCPRCGKSIVLGARAERKGI